MVGPPGTAFQPFLRFWRAIFDVRWARLRFQPFLRFWMKYRARWLAIKWAWYMFQPFLRFWGRRPARVSSASLGFNPS